MNALKTGVKLWHGGHHEAVKYRSVYREEDITFSPSSHFFSAILGRLPDDPLLSGGAKVKRVKVSPG